jgi:hypothetical protein
MDLQALMDGMDKRMELHRAETQMTLGKLIERLRSMPKNAHIQNICNPHSYRGYYSDLAFELGTNTRTVGEVLEDCKSSMGQVFNGYKGGDYPMHHMTPLWVASYGCCGKKLIDIANDGSLITAEDD